LKNIFFSKQSAINEGIRYLGIEQDENSNQLELIDTLDENINVFPSTCIEGEEIFNRSVLDYNIKPFDNWPKWKPRRVAIYKIPIMK
jgi:hypothetical protein